MRIRNTTTRCVKCQNIAKFNSPDGPSPCWSSTSSKTPKSLLRPLSVAQILSRKPQVHIISINKEEVAKIHQNQDQLRGVRRIVPVDEDQSLLMYSDVEGNFDILATALENLDTFNSRLPQSRTIYKRGRSKTKVLGALITVVSVLVGVFAWREGRTVQCMFSLNVHEWSPLTVS